MYFPVKVNELFFFVMNLRQVSVAKRRMDYMLTKLTAPNISFAQAAAYVMFLLILTAQISYT